MSAFHVELLLAQERVDNDLFYYENASLVFGDAKETVEKITNALNES